MTAPQAGGPAPRCAYLPRHAEIVRGFGLAPDFGSFETVRVDRRFLEFFIEEYARLIPFDAGFYARCYADLAEAASRGTVPDLHAHFVANGFREGRLPGPPRFDPVYYLESNPDLVGLHESGGAPALLAHYLRHGRAEGRFGHPLERMDAERWRQYVPVGRNNLARACVDDAVVRAFRPPAIAADQRGFRGGPELGDTPLADLLRHRRGGRAVDRCPTDDTPDHIHMTPLPLPGHYAYGGIAYAHFGHVMAETIHRVLPTRRLFGRRKLLFVDEFTGAPPSGFDSLPQTQREALAYLQVPPEDVVVLHDDRVVDRLEIAQQGCELNGVAHAEYLAMLTEFSAARLDAAWPGGEEARRVYVSRSRLSDRGLLLGETYLERQLALEGWTIFHPQAHSLIEQMQRYYRAEILVFAGGSAIHGTELLGVGQLGDCFIWPRWDTQTRFYHKVLAPRARHVRTLPPACLLGSPVVDAATGARQDQWGVSLPNWAALVHALRAEGLAELRHFNADIARRAARAELAEYIGNIRKLGEIGLPLVDASGFARFEAEVMTLI